MQKIETLEAFYQHKFSWLPDTLKQDSGHMNVFRLEDHVGASSTPVPYSRRDFYKISLIRGDNLYHYADKSIQVSGPTLLFFNPLVPYTWECLSGETSGYFCIFKEAFFTNAIPGGLHELPMFSPGGKPAYALTETQEEAVSLLFEKMLAEVGTNSAYKYDLLRSYVSELIYTTLKLQPSETLHQHPDARARTTAAFIELLERQFPIESPTQRFRLRSAGDFARHLSVHVNYLNRCVRATTGKTTTTQIAERVTSEARALLKHTDWNIAEISYCLGFDEPAHFTYFFKKQTGLSPSAFRRLV